MKFDDKWTLLDSVVGSDALNTMLLFPSSLQAWRRMIMKYTTKVYKRGMWCDWPLWFVQVNVAFQKKIKKITDKSHAIINPRWWSDGHRGDFWAQMTCTKFPVTKLNIIIYLSKHTPRSSYCLLTNSLHWVRNRNAYLLITHRRISNLQPLQTIKCGTTNSFRVPREPLPRVWITFPNHDCASVSWRISVTAGAVMEISPPPP